MKSITTEYLQLPIILYLVVGGRLYKLGWRGINLKLIERTIATFKYLPTYSEELKVGFFLKKGTTTIV